MAPLRIPIYQVDAFAARTFQGNPASVCPLPEWLPDETLQAIAAENKHSETAFFVPVGPIFHLRWFTPVAEVALCGHATLAAAHVLFRHLGRMEETVTFNSLSGLLPVRRRGDALELDFPKQAPISWRAPNPLLQAFGLEEADCLKGGDFILVLKNQAQVEKAKPDLALLRKLDLRGAALTAPGDAHDFVCRFFAPRWGIDEDPVTGSLFTQLAPYWAERLGKSELKARQVSERGGEVACRVEGDRVFIQGKAVTYLRGEIEVPTPEAD